MPIAPVNQTKNIVSPVGQDRLGFFLMTEDNFILETEDGFLLMLDSATYGLSGENQAKSPNAGATIHSGESIGLLLSLTYPTTFTLGSGWVNSNKN